ncbi:pentapeptide repeat-containing protein [Kitasatospora cineracea]|uniref:pentapeptide repeat-containing protein n=1 Tax=Kitasatospora cineracea TaxID=88074 RepID=UPI0013C3410E|nr:pentapeptide repeat-containing protein [Kitasatospora cineracea]
MDSTFGRVTVTLPNLTEPGLYLSNVTAFDSARGIVQDFQYADANLRNLDLTDTNLITGRVTGLRADRVQFEKIRLDSVEFDGCDLATARITDAKLSRVVFRNCKIMGAAFTGVTLDNVLFENCKLDYSSFEQVRAIGPLAFSKCVLNETTFTGSDLSRAVLDACSLRLAEFGRGKYQDLDLRGNDLSTVRGAANLGKVIIDRAQQAELAEALVAELDVTFADTLDSRR